MKNGNSRSSSAMAAMIVLLASSSSSSSSTGGSRCRRSGAQSSFPFSTLAVHAFSSSRPSSISSISRSGGRRRRRSRNAIVVVAVQANDNDESAVNTRKRRAPSSSSQPLHSTTARRRPTASTSSSTATAAKTSSSTMSTALCIIPPSDIWDTLQRARHAAGDGSYYKWPPAIRLFHPFVPVERIASEAGKLAEWIDTYHDDYDDDYDDKDECNSDTNDDNIDDDETNKKIDLLHSFEIILDSILILPHWEILDDRIDRFEKERQQRGRQRWPVGVEPADGDWGSTNIATTATTTTTQEDEYHTRIMEGRKLIQDEERKGMERKRARERKKLLQNNMGNENNNNSNNNNNDGIEENDNMTEDVNYEKGSSISSSSSSSYNGPCVVYLSPNESSTEQLVALRSLLCTQLYSEYDPYSPSSTVSSSSGSSVERLPQENRSKQQYRPLLPIGRFATVAEAVKVARVMQKSWEPLCFNVTDLQFISRQDKEGGGGGNRRGEDDTDDSSSRSRVSVSSSSSSGEVDDASRRGVYGCDVMISLRGEEPEEAIMEDDASLSMIMDDVDDDCDDTNNGQKQPINYNEIFSLAEREYQRMVAHENNSYSSAINDIDNSMKDATTAAPTSIEAWLDDDDEDVIQDEGATVVIGRAQFFMGAMREFIGMPASSAIDSKDRIVGSGGVSANSRRKGSVHPGDYGNR